MSEKIKLKHVLKFLLAGLLSIFLLVIAGLGVIYYLAVSGQENIPEMIQRKIAEQTDIDLVCEYYQFNYHTHFPFLALQMKNVSLKGQSDTISERPVLEMETISILFKPVKLLKKKFEIKSMVLTNGLIFIYQNENGQRNTDFLGRKEVEGKDKATSFKLLDDLKLKNVIVEYQDDTKPQYHKLKFKSGKVELSTDQRGYKVDLDSDCHFYGLTFNPLKGSFLENIDGHLETRIEIDTVIHKINIQPSTLSVNDMDIQIEGSLELKKQGLLELKISHPAVFLGKGRRILNTRLANKLEAFESDSPFDVEVHLYGKTGVPEKMPLTAVFSTQDAKILAKGFNVSQARVKGKYDNKCENTEGVADTAKCLNIYLEEGLLFDQLPVRAHIMNDGISKTPLEIHGVLETQLKDINRYLEDSELRFTDGSIRFPFELIGDPSALFNPDIKGVGAAISGHLEVEEGKMYYAPNKLSIKHINTLMQIKDRNLEVDTISFVINDRPYFINGEALDFVPMLLRKPHNLTASLKLEIDTLNLDNFFPKVGASQHNSDTLSLKMLESFSRSGELTLEVEANRLSFRKLSVDKTCFSALLIRECENEKACVKVTDFSGTIYDSIRLSADLIATELRNPWVKMQLHIEAPLTQFASLSPRDMLALKSGKLSLDMNFDGRMSDYFGIRENILSGRFKGEARIKKGALNYLPLDYKIVNLNTVLRFDERQLFVDKLDMSLNGNQLLADGYVRNFTPFIVGQNQAPLWANLDVYTPRLDFSTLKYIKEDQPSTTDKFSATMVTRSMQDILDQVEGTLVVNADEMVFRSFDMTDVKFNAEFFRQCDAPDEAQSCVDIDTFSAHLWGSAPLNASLSIRGLQNPFFDAKVTVGMPMVELNRMFPPGQFDFTDGSLNAEFTYQGSPNDQFDVNSNLLKAKINGRASISSGAMNFKPRGFRFRNMQGTFSFDEQKLAINDLQSDLNNNHLEVHGEILNFMPFLLKPDQRLNADLSLKCPHFSFDRFKAPQKYKGQRKGKAVLRTQLTNTVDAALQQLDTKFRVELDTVSYLKFLAKDVNGIFNFQPDFLRFNDVSMQVSDGDLALNGQISGVQRHAPEINVRAKFAAVDVQKVFHAFDNFGQEGLQAENIEGKLNADITFQTKGNANYDLNPSAHQGNFHLEISNGALKDFPPLKAMNGFLFKKRNMDNVQFANLENTFSIEGEQLKIDHFYVVSNVLDFGIQGTYSLGGEQETALLFEIPISNIFNANAKISNGRKSKGRNRMLPILIEATEEDGKLDLDYRLFRGKWSK